MEFTEHQRAPRVMHWIMFGAAVFSFGFVLVTSVLLAISENAPVTDEVLVPIVLHATVFGLVWIMFWRSTLNVVIDAAGVQVRFTPFHRKPRVFAWTDVERVIIRKVSPFGEFGGWGIRWNFGKTTGYVWRGTTGIDLRMRDGRRIVVTIVDIEAATNVVQAVVPTDVEYEQRIADIRG